MSEENPPPPLLTIRMNNITVEDKLQSKGYTFFCWILTIGIWINIGLLIYYSKSLPIITEENFYKNFEYYRKLPKIKTFLGILLLIVYIIYFLAEVTSPIFKYLYNKSDENFEEKMKNLFYDSKPSFTLKYRKSGKFCNNNFRKTYNFFSYYWRDTSGLFQLNSDKRHINNKKYIILNLKKEIRFADMESDVDYKNAKENFIKENFNETHEIKEEIIIEDLKQYYLFKLKNYNEDEMEIVNHQFYILFTLLSFAELYKIYINYVSIYQVFTIRKLVSTRKENLGIEYEKFNPALNLINEIKIFNGENPIKMQRINEIDNENNQNEFQGIENGNNFQFGDKDTNDEDKFGRNYRINNNKYFDSINKRINEKKFTN